MAARRARDSAADAQPPGHILDAQALGREQDDAGALDLLEQARLIVDDRGELGRISSTIRDTRVRLDRFNMLYPEPVAT